jgi:hypothetical protein
MTLVKKGANDSYRSLSDPHFDDTKALSVRIIWVEGRETGASVTVKRTVARD